VATLCLAVCVVSCTVKDEPAASEPERIPTAVRALLGTGEACKDAADCPGSACVLHACVGALTVDVLAVGRTLTEGLASADPDAQRDARALLLGLVDDARTDTTTRVRSLLALGMLPPEPESDGVLELMRSDSNPRLCAAANLALARRKDGRAAEELRRYARVGSEPLRAASVRALGAYGDERDVPLFVALLEGPSPSLAVAALDALAAIGSRGARAAIDRLAARDDEPLSYTAARILEGAGAR